MFNGLTITTMESMHAFFWKKKHKSRRLHTDWAFVILRNDCEANNEIIIQNSTIAIFQRQILGYSD